jgi:hypothetical protein
MPRDERKRQKALMKKRSKQKAATQHRSQQQDFMSLSAAAIIRRARSFPIFECRISDTWDKEEPGLVQILLARKQPDGDICFGIYLVDKYCLGVKNTLVNAHFSLARYEDDVLDGIFGNTKMEECPLELAHQMIYQSIDYAAKYGFEPHKDFALAQNLLVSRGELPAPYQLTFGKNGKPFYVEGPHDNSARIMKQLDKTAGPGNYHYIAKINPFQAGLSEQLDLEDFELP